MIPKSSYWKVQKIPKGKKEVGSSRFGNGAPSVGKVGSSRPVENRGDTNKYKTYKEVVCHNLLWPVSPNPLLHKIKNKEVILFSKKDLKPRLTRLQACLVSRIVGAGKIRVD